MVAGSNPIYPMRDIAARLLHVITLVTLLSLGCWTSLTFADVRKIEATLSEQRSGCEASIAQSGKGVDLPPMTANDAIRILLKPNAQLAPNSPDLLMAARKNGSALTGKDGLFKLIKAVEETGADAESIFTYEYNSPYLTIDKPKEEPFSLRKRQRKIGWARRAMRFAKFEEKLAESHVQDSRRPVVAILDRGFTDAAFSSKKPMLFNQNKTSFLCGMDTLSNDNDVCPSVSDLGACTIGSDRLQCHSPSIEHHGAEHGTSMAVALAGRDGLGATEYVSPLIYRIAPTPTNMPTHNPMAMAVEHAIGKADIILIAQSLACKDGRLELALKKATQEGIIVITAAGYKPIGYPTQYSNSMPELVVVGGLYDESKILPSRSAKIQRNGDGLDIDIWGPGSNLAAIRFDSEGELYLENDFGGTSSASAFVAGAAALLLRAGFTHQETTEKLTFDRNCCIWADDHPNARSTRCPIFRMNQKWIVPGTLVMPALPSKRPDAT